MDKLSRIELLSRAEQLVLMQRVAASPSSRFTRPPQQPPVSSEAAAEQPVFVDETGQGYVDGDA